MSSQKIKKSIGLRLGQELWAMLGRWRQVTGLPWDNWALRLSLFPLAPLYVLRLGWAHGLGTLGRFFAGQGDFKIYRSQLDPGLYIRESSTDAYVFQQIFIMQDYSRAQGRDKVYCIIDAGAYVGFSAIYFAELYPHAIIYAIEAESSNFHQLQKNIRNYPNIVAIHAALWSEDGWVSIGPDPAASGQWGFTVKANTSSTTAKLCPALSLSTFIDQYQITSIDIIKIDIEGAESTVFAPSSCHTWLAKVKFLIIELHDHLFPDSHQTFLTAMQHYEFAVQSQGENLLFDFQNLERALKADLR